MAPCSEKVEIRICLDVWKNNRPRCWEMARERSLVMETTEQFWCTRFIMVLVKMMKLWCSRARGDTTGTKARREAISSSTRAPAGGEHPFGFREERTKKCVRRCETSSTNIFGRKLEGRRVGEGSRGRREESSSSCAASTCR